MPAIGAELPPHLLAKRKRKQEEEAENEATTASGAKRAPSPAENEKRRRVVGPAMPPAALDERPQALSQPPEASDSDDDDGFGPALPPDNADESNADGVEDYEKSTTSHPDPTPARETIQRDEWMMIPPKQDDLAARMDPTKQRARGFNTSKGARGPKEQGDNSIWHETPEMRQKRLADEMMGVSKPSASGAERPIKDIDTTRDEAAAQKIRQHTEKTRGPSLLDQHQRSKGEEALEDDPSKRAFDREKDMSSGVRIGHAQRQEMLNKASNFSSKFAGGGYL